MPVPYRHQVLPKNMLTLVQDHRYRFGCLLLLYLVANAAVAQGASPPPRCVETKQETMKEAIARGELIELESDIALASSRLEYFREIERGNVARTNYLISRFETEIALRDSEVTLFNNQQKMELPIFALVFVIVLTSLYLAHAQLRAWLKRGGTEKPADTTALAINRDGLTLNTPFVGLLMLVGAFAFFYMYIDKVYSVQQRSDALRRQIELYPKTESGAAAAPSLAASQSEK